MTTVTSASSSSSSSSSFSSFLSGRIRRRHGGGIARNGRSHNKSSRRRHRVIVLFVVVVVGGLFFIVAVVKNLGIIVTVTGIGTGTGLFHFVLFDYNNDPYEGKILPHTLYVVYGLESSGTTLMVDTITNALQLPVQLRQGHDTVESLSRQIHIQHLSLPMGVDVDNSNDEEKEEEEEEKEEDNTESADGSGSNQFDLPIIDVYLPKRCHVYHDDSSSRNIGMVGEAIQISKDFTSARMRRRSKSTSTSTATTRTLTTLPVSDLCRPLLQQTTKATKKNDRSDALAVSSSSSSSSFSRYFVNITSHVQWYRDRGVVVYPILVVRDPLYRIQSVLKKHLAGDGGGSDGGSEKKKTSDKNKKNKKKIQKAIQQYKTGHQIIQQSIEQFSQFSQPKQQQNSKQQPGLVIVSYESLMTIGPTYLTHMIYPQLGIYDTDDGNDDHDDHDHRRDSTKPTTTIYTPALTNGNLKYAAAADYHSKTNQDEDPSIQDIIDYLLQLEQ